jgi:hypothetical protein
MKLGRIRAVMVTAQETYREMMKTQVAPALPAMREQIGD